MICTFRFYLDPEGNYAEKRIRFHGDGHTNVVQWAECAEAFRCGYIAGTGQHAILMGVEELGLADADFDDRKAMPALLASLRVQKVLCSAPATAKSHPIDFLGTATHYIIAEGGEWQPWERNHMNQKNVPNVFAVKFDSGWVWDRLVGWRRASA